MARKRAPALHHSFGTYVIKHGNPMTSSGHNCGGNSPSTITTSNCNPGELKMQSQGRWGFCEGGHGSSKLVFLRYAWYAGSLP